MTELQIYKFVTENELEYHWLLSEDEEDVMLFMSFEQLAVFAKLLTYGFTEGCYSIVLKDNYVCVWMRDVCEYYDIELHSIFKRQYLTN